MKSGTAFTMRIVNCCAICTHRTGTLEAMKCALHGLVIEPYTMCDNFEKVKDLFSHKPSPDGEV